MNDIFKLFGTIAINNAGANKAIDETGQKANKLHNITQKAFNGIGKAAAACGKAVAAGLAVSAAAVGALMKASIGSYAEYEQLVGGVETLFKDSSETVMKYAKNAYKTAGLSANDYMSTVTSFSASLLQGLGGDTAAAAEMANLAITDMSDNANKMGTDMGMIQNAYQGFAKQNYTMLDNLKIGYGGTQSEMARLINDSGVLGDKIKVTAETVNDVSFAKIIEAIHVVQTEMGITGTTAKEATETISGSFNTWKASWTNLLTGMADDENIEPLVDAFFDAGQNVLRNVGKVIPKVVRNIGSAMQQLGTRIRSWVADDVWPEIQKFAKAKFGIDLPTWGEIETAVYTWWQDTKQNLQNFCTWTLKLFEAPHEAANEAGAAIADWWENTAKPGILAVSTWALNLFGVPIEGGATIKEHVKAWWSGINGLVTGACSWVLQLFGVPAETANTVFGIIKDWWDGISGTVVDACAWFLGLPGNPNSEDLVTAITRWWNRDAKRKIPEFFATVKVHLSYVWDNLTLAGGVITGENEVTSDGEHNYVNGQTNDLIDALSSPTIKQLTGGEYGYVKPDGYEAHGLDYVPKDNFRAMLHLGEKVLPRNEAEAYRKGHGSAPDMGGLEAAINNLIALTQQVVSNTSMGHNIVLDSGALVGQTVRLMDAELGNITGRKGRRG